HPHRDRYHLGPIWEVLLFLFYIFYPACISLYRNVVRRSRIAPGGLASDKMEGHNPYQSTVRPRTGDWMEIRLVASHLYTKFPAVAGHSTFRFAVATDQTS